MSCAGCEDCDDRRWHLHVTVEKLDASKFRDVPRGDGYELDMRRIGARPVRVCNLVQYADGYEELIPTLHFGGTLARAQHEIVLLACNLWRLGYVPRRVKIEGAPGLVAAREQLYWESHVSVPRTAQSLGLLRELSFEGWRPALSTLLREDGTRSLIVTIRGHQSEVTAILGRLREALFDRVPILRERTEVCVMDTARELDDRWLGG